MGNPDTLRRISLVAMIIAIVTGTISLYFLFTAPRRDMTLAMISAVALVIGLVVDWRANKLDDRNA